ncbi:MAG: ATP-binding protein, partial [Muribaculaceae bacterium]|nr:ATP-binding protein [Muribaculaceae bacterium]
YRAKLASLYSNFKSSSEHLRLVFLTGVSRFSKLSIFSDLNNLNDITFDDAFADICGVTVKEINTILSPGIEKLADKLRITVEQTERELKENYDGYRFTENGSHVYNPWSLLSCLYKGKIEYYWNDTGLPTLIAETLRRSDVNLEDTLDSYCGESDLKGLDLLNPNPTALLFQTGYLTIKDYDRRIKSYRLGLPNNEVKFGLFNVLIPYYVTTKPVEGNILVKEIARNFIFGEPEKGMKGLQSYFAGIDYAMRMDNENNFHNAFFLLMDMIGLNTATESHTSEGRIDIEIKTENYVYIIELKYDHPAEEALRQIQERNYGRKYQLDSRKLILIGASFSSKTRCIESWKILVVPRNIRRMP